MGQKRKLGETSSSSNEPKSTKRKNFQEEMFSFLKEMREERKKRDENMMNQFTKMHKEQMKMFSSLIEVLKES